MITQQSPCIMATAIFNYNLHILGEMKYFCHINWTVEEQGLTISQWLPNGRPHGIPQGSPHGRLKDHMADHKAVHMADLQTIRQTTWPLLSVIKWHSLAISTLFFNPLSLKMVPKATQTNIQSHFFAVFAYLEMTHNLYIHIYNGLTIVLSLSNYTVCNVQIPAGEFKKLYKFSWV